MCVYIKQPDIHKAMNIHQNQKQIADLKEKQKNPDLTLDEHADLQDQINKLQEEIDALDITIEEVYNNINEAYNTIKTIDAKGSFEADDEVGFFFVVLKDLSEKLKGMFIIEKTKKDNE